MATIQLTEPYFYKAGVGGVSRVVGVESRVTRVARYRFTAPATGASRVSLTFRGAEHAQGQAAGLRFHITTDPDSYANPGTDAPYTGSLTLEADTATGSGPAVLLPGQTYYLWVFPATRVYGWYSWALLSATMETAGGSCSVPNAQGGILGREIPITVTAYAPFTHRLLWQFGEESGIIGENITDSCTWTPPLTLAAQIPNSVSGVATLICETWDGDTCIGSRSLYLPLAVPEDMVPTVTAAWTDAAQAPAALGRLVQHISKLSVEVTAAGSYGSQVLSAAVMLNGAPYAGEALPESGEIPLSVTVTDSRGRKATWQEVLTVESYQPPRLTLTAHRCDADGNADDAGEYAAISVTGSISPLALNSGYLTLYYGLSSSRITLQGGDFTYSKVISAPSDCVMQLRAVASDRFLTAQRQLQLSVGYATVDFLAGGKGIALGTVATKAGFTCNMPQDMCGQRLYNLPQPQAESDAAPMSLALPYRGELTDPDGALQGLYRYQEGFLLHLGDAQNALQLSCTADSLTSRLRLDGQWVN